MRNIFPVSRRWLPSFIPKDKPSAEERFMTVSLCRNGRATLLAGVLVSLVNGILYAWSVFVLPIEQATGWTRPQTSLVFTFILIFFGTGMMTGGYIMRRFGPTLTAAGGGMLLALGLAASAFASSPWQLVLAYGMVGGYGIGVANIVPQSTGLSWYPEKRGIVCGLMAFSLATGTVVLGSGLAGSLLPGLGVSHTLLCMAGLVLIISLPSSLFLSSRTASRSDDHARPLEGLTTRQMIRTTSFRLVWLWTLALQTGGLMIVGHVVPYAVEQGASMAQAGFAMGVYAVANGAGRLIFGLLFDSRGCFFALLTDALCMIAGLLLLTVLPSVAGYGGLLGALILIALAFGGTIPQFSAFIAQNFGPAHMETNIGMTATVFIIAGFAGPYAGGWIHALTGSYAMAILMSAAIGCIGILAVLCLPRHIRHR